MQISRRRSHRAPSLQTRQAGLVAAVVCAWLAVFAGVAPAREDRGLLRLTVSVVAPSGAVGPMPTGTVAVTVDGRRLASLTLSGGLASLTSITPQLIVALRAFGHR